MTLDPSSSATFSAPPPASAGDNKTSSPSPEPPSDGGRRLRVLLIAPYYNLNAAGESWSTYKWVQGISQRHDVTVLTTHTKGWHADSSPVEAKEIINWTYSRLPNAFARFERELKPSYILFYVRARRWLKKALREGREFDLVHQINPLAMRYPCPARGLGLKYIMGPVAGSLETPDGFRDGLSDKQWYRKLRNLDRWRIIRDPMMRDTYAGAELILGVAPYIEEFLQPVGIKRFEVASETGVETVSGQPKTAPAPGEPLRLLFVGRIIRTKGVIDAVRAVALARKTCNITFDVIGEGDMLEACKAEAAALGASDIIHFHGRLPRQEVDAWYERSHIFLFPSFREPSGNVVFEAMGHGLPVIACDRGGPGHVVDDSCGVIVEPTTISQYAEQLALAIREQSERRHCIPERSEAAYARIMNLAFWDTKIERLSALYESLTAKAAN